MHMYTATFKDQHDARHTVQAIEEDKMIVMVPAPEVEQLVKLFAGAEQEQVLAFRRLYGAVQLLLGGGVTLPAQGRFASCRRRQQRISLVPAWLR